MNQAAGRFVVLINSDIYIFPKRRLLTHYPSTFILLFIFQQWAETAHGELMNQKDKHGDTKVCIYLFLSQFYNEKESLKFFFFSNHNL